MVAQSIMSEHVCVNKSFIAIERNWEKALCENNNKKSQQAIYSIELDLMNTERVVGHNINQL